MNISILKCSYMPDRNPIVNEVTHWIFCPKGPSFTLPVKVLILVKFVYALYVQVTEQYHVDNFVKAQNTDTKEEYQQNYISLYYLKCINT